MFLDNMVTGRLDFNVRRFFIEYLVLNYNYFCYMLFKNNLWEEQQPECLDNMPNTALKKALPY